MKVRCVKAFCDMARKVTRLPGDTWDEDPTVFARVNSSVHGTLMEAVGGNRPTKAELLAEARSLGVEVPEGATNPQIAKLIEEAS